MVDGEETEQWEKTERWWLTSLTYTRHLAFVIYSFTQVSDSV